MGDQEVTIRIAAKNLTEAEFKKARAQVVGLGRDTGKTGKQTKSFTASFVRLGASIISVHAAMRLVSAGFREINQFISASIKASSDFDDAFTKSTAIMGDLSEVMSIDMVTAAELVAKTTTFSATEAAEAYFFLASAGLDAAQSIGALPTVSKFAQAGAFDLARATDLLTDAQSALGLTIKNDTIVNMKNMGRVSDVLVKANTLANASVEQFSTSLTTKAGPALKILGKDIEEGVAVLAAFADQGIKGAESGTALNIVLRDLSTKAIINADAFKKNKVAVFDSSGEMRNIADIISDLENRLAGMSDEQAKATLQQLGFADKSVIFIQTLIGMSDRIREYEVELRKAGGTTEEVADKQLKSFAAQWKITSNNIVLFLKNLGDFVTQAEGVQEVFRVIREAASDATEFLKKNKEAFTELSREGLAEVIESFAIFFDVVGKGLDATAKWFKFWWTITKNTLLLFPRLMSDSVQQFVDSTDLAIEATDRLGDVLDDTLAERMPELARAIRATGETITEEVAAINEELSHLDFVGPLQPAIEFLGAYREEFEKLGDPLGDFRDHFDKLTIAHREFNKELPTGNKNLGNLADTITTKINPAFQKFYASMLDNAPQVQGLTFAYIDATSSLDKWGQSWLDFVPQVHTATQEIEAAATATQGFADVLQQAANLTTIFGGSLGSIFGGGASAIGGFESLFGGGKGLEGFFEGFQKKVGDEFTTSIGSILSDLGSALPAIGALAGPAIQGIQALIGVFKKPEYVKVFEDVGRDWGVGISEGLSQQIANLSDQIGDRATAVQLSLGGLFTEAIGSGAANFDLLAQKAADTFSFLERGQITSAQAQQILNESVAQLLPHLDELGPAGEAQIQRLINAAQEFGVTFEGLAQLGGPISSSLQDIMGQFKLSNQEAKELAKLLGVDVKTSTQKLAAELGVTPKILKEIGAAIEAKYGIPLDGIQGLLDTMGVSIEDLATAFEIDIPGSVVVAGGSVGTLQTQIDDLGKTRITIPVEFDVGNFELPDTEGGKVKGAQAGGLFSRPSLRVIAEHEPEVVGSPNAIVRAFRDAMEQTRIGTASPSAQIDFGPVLQGFERMESRLAALPRSIQRAVRDGVLLAS